MKTQSRFTIYLPMVIVLGIHKAQQWGGDRYAEEKADSFLIIYRKKGYLDQKSKIIS